MAEETKEAAKERPDKARRLWGSERRRWEEIDRRDAMDGDAGASDPQSREIKSFH